MGVFRRTFSILILLAGVFSAFLCSRATDPYLRPMPAYGFAIVVMLAVLVAWSIVRRRPRRLLPWLTLIAWGATPVALAASLISFDLARHEVLAATAEEAALLGSHFVVGYDDTADVTPLVRRGLVGGLFLNRHNIAGRPATLREEIAGFQADRKGLGLPALIVTADQEGGIVSHLAPPLTRFPSLALLGTLPAAERDSQALQQGVNQGRELAALGVTLDLSPVVDLQRSRPRSRLDFESHIAERAISADPEITAAIAGAYADGLRQAGVGATFKHFPGLGRIEEDTHHFAARLDAAVDDLEASDWRPFHALLDRKQAVLMVGHVVLAAIDPDRPASHSKAVIQGLLRERWHHQGLVITDDMVMGPVYQRGLCTGVVEALNAGVDLILVAYDGRQYYKAMECALTALHHGELDRAMLTQSAERLAIYRAGLPLVARTALSP